MFTMENYKTPKEGRAKKFKGRPHGGAVGVNVKWSLQKRVLETCIHCYKTLNLFITRVELGEFQSTFPLIVGMYG